MGNLKVFNKFKEFSYCRSAIKTLCDDDIEIDRMVELGEKFYINLYGKVAAKENSLDQVRKIMYNLPNIPITRMPSTSLAFYFHILRAYLQVNTWKHWNLTNLVSSVMKRATSQRSLLKKNMHWNTCFRKWSAVARNQIERVYCVQVVHARNLGYHVLPNVVVNVLTIAVKYAALPLNSLFTLVLRLRKSWWVLLLLS